MAKRKYEVLHPIRFERRKSIKRGAVIELEADKAHEWRHALKILPQEVQDGGLTSPTGQDPQAKAPQDAAETVAAGDSAGPTVAPEDRADDAGAITTSAVSTNADGEKPEVTAGARIEADRLGISLDHVRATGMGNTLTKKDVQREAKRLREEASS